MGVHRLLGVGQCQGPAHRGILLHLPAQLPLRRLAHCHVHAAVQATQAVLALATSRRPQPPPVKTMIPPLPLLHVPGLRRQRCWLPSTKGHATSAGWGQCAIYTSKRGYYAGAATVSQRQVKDCLKSSRVGIHAEQGPDVQCAIEYNTRFSCCSRIAQWQRQEQGTAHRAFAHAVDPGEGDPRVDSTVD